jgi:hydrogenase nickel incorporation protein HypA/HybF
MHELKIAESLVEQVEAVRQANGGGRVISVDVRIGAWRQIVPEVLTSYFGHLAQSTPLEGARIEIDQVDATGHCSECEEIFALNDIFLVCPRCGSAVCTLVTGGELDLVGVELE